MHKDGFVATHGWLETSKVKAIELGKALGETLVRKHLFLRILLQMVRCLGLIWRLLCEMAEATGKSVIASGGVSSLADLDALKKYEATELLVRL